MKVIISLLLMAIMGCSSAGKDKTRANLIAQIGIAQLNAGNYPQALAELLRAKELDPENPVILNNVGLAYFFRGDLRQAEEHLQRALSFAPQYTDARNNYGRLLIETRNYRKAERQLKLAIKDLTYTYPEKPLTNMGYLYLKEGNTKKARYYLVKAIRANRNFCTSYNYYGQTLFQENNFAKSSQIFDSALKICKKIPQEVHYYGALSYYKNKKIDKSIARFEEIINLYPESDYAQKAESLLKIIRQERK